VKKWSFFSRSRNYIKNRKQFFFRNEGFKNSIVSRVLRNDVQRSSKNVIILNISPLLAIYFFNIQKLSFDQNGRIFYGGSDRA